MYTIMDKNCDRVTLYAPPYAPFCQKVKELPEKGAELDVRVFVIARHRHTRARHASYCALFCPRSCTLHTRTTARRTRHVSPGLCVVLG